MRAPTFQHITGTDLLRRCDFDRLTIDPVTETVRLVPVEAVSRDGAAAPIDADAFEGRRRRMGDGVAVGCAPDMCSPASIVISDPSAGDLFVLDGSEWISLTSQIAPDAGHRPGRFSATATPSVSMVPAGLQLDRYGRLWLHDRARRTLLILRELTLDRLAEIAPPPGVTIGAFAVHKDGVAIADAGRLFVQRFGGDWSEVGVQTDGTSVLAGYRPVAGSGDPFGDGWILARPDDPADPSRIVRFHDLETSVFELVELKDPLYLLAFDSGILVGEALADPFHDSLHIFHHYRLTGPDSGLARASVFGVRGFDGRALFLDASGAPFASTATAARPLFERLAKRVSTGRLETYALDSEQYGCPWHRVFVDLCLPENTAVVLSAKTSDDLPPPALRRDPEKPQGGIVPVAPGDEEEAVSVAWANRPLGGRSRTDDEDWFPVGVLDRRPALVDRAFHDADRVHPSDDQLRRDPQPVPLPLETLEGLIKAPPGRYLWLRVRFDGDGRRSPALRALRATHARPSMLSHLPAYWRADGERADAADRALALFEGFVTELDGRIGAIPNLLDPRLCPAEALEWLSGFVGLVFDTRLEQAVRRQLLIEASWLFRHRGTVPAMERLCSILAGHAVSVVEGFRLRSGGGAELSELRRNSEGEPLGVLDSALRLGGGGDIPEEDWEQSLRQSFEDLLARRRRTASEGQVLCPDREPDPPLDDRPVIALYRRFAHRFTIIVHGPECEPLADILETAIEINKPAHTLHRICWLQSGFSPGVTSYVGIGTRFTEPTRFRPGILGDAVAGGSSTVSRPSDPSAPLPGFFVGKTTLSKASRHPIAPEQGDRHGSH